MSKGQGIEIARVMTVSIEHLHPETVSFLDGVKGDLKEGPSIAVRREGFLVNSHAGMESALEQEFENGFEPSLYDRFPDLVLIRTLARSLGAEWINIDVDGVIYADVLPVYGDDGEVTRPSADGWNEALSTLGKTARGVEMIIPSRQVLEMIEAGQTPRVTPTPAPGM